MTLRSTLAVAALCLSSFAAFAADAPAPAAAPSPEAAKRMEACKADADKFCKTEVAAKAAGTGEKGAIGKCLDGHTAELAAVCAAARVEAKAAAPGK